MDHTQKTKKLNGARKLAFYLLVIGIICAVVAGILGFRIFNRIGLGPSPMPRQTDVSLIQDWMTIRHISRTYRVPEKVLFEKLNLSPQYETASLSKIADSTGVELAILLESIKIIVNDFQSSRPDPPFPN